MTLYFAADKLLGNTYPLTYNSNEHSVLCGDHKLTLAVVSLWPNRTTVTIECRDALDPETWTWRGPCLSRSELQFSFLAVLHHLQHRDNNKGKTP